MNVNHPWTELRPVEGNPPEFSLLAFDLPSGMNRSPILRFENPPAEGKRPGMTIAIGFPMPLQPCVTAAPLGHAAVEVFTTFGDLTGKGTIPRPTRIFDVIGPPKMIRLFAKAT